MAAEHRIVVADDEPRFIKLFHTLLDDTGTVKIIGEACNGTEALALANNLLPDAMIIDLYMPDMNGLEVIRKIKAQLPTLRTILVSSHWEPMYDRMAALDGGAEFIPKARLSTHLLLQALR
jgi:DNA-binding NarL/FixJ family response regulator